MVKFENNNGVKIFKKGTIILGYVRVNTEEVIFIIGLKYNMLIINQIYDIGNDFIFKKHVYEIKRENNEKLVAHGTRIYDNIYTLVKNIEDSCMMSQ